MKSTLPGGESKRHHNWVQLALEEQKSKADSKYKNDGKCQSCALKRFLMVKITALI